MSQYFAALHQCIDRSWQAGFLEAKGGEIRAFHCREFRSRKRAERWIRGVTGIDHSAWPESITLSDHCAWYLDELPDRRAQQAVLEAIELGGLEEVLLTGRVDTCQGRAER